MDDVQSAWFAEMERTRLRRELALTDAIARGSAFKRTDALRQLHAMLRDTHEVVVLGLPINPGLDVVLSSARLVSAFYAVPLEQGKALLWLWLKSYRRRYGMSLGCERSQPPGWHCQRSVGHPGPCALVEKNALSRVSEWIDRAGVELARLIDAACLHWRRRP